MVNQASHIDVSSQVEGDGNEVLNVAGDLILGDSFKQEAPKFYQPSFDRFELASPDFVQPKVDIWIDLLERTNLLVFGGAYRYKLDLMRYCAWVVLNKLKRQQQSESVDNELQVLEWYRSSDPQNLLATIEESAHTTIFILPHIVPKDINFDIERLATAAKGRHFVLVTSELAKAHWKLPASLQGCWEEPDAADLYVPGRLSRYLEYKLEQTEIDLTKLVADKPYEVLVEGWALHLNAPDKIDVFVQFIGKEVQSRDGLTAEKIPRLLSLSERKDDEFLSYWFHHLLEPREQMLALGLAFFDGLLEDQCFAALEHIVQSGWLKRDSSLVLLDYSDLSNLMNFFRFDRTYDHASGEFSRVRCRFPDLRKKLVECAWHSHRRLILAALPGLVELAQNSVGGRHNNFELYGTYRRQKQLRQVLSETICDIGRLSQGFVDTALMHLVADDYREVQAVAAQAMAGWARYEEVDLYGWLKRWRHQRYFITLIDTVLEQQKKERRQSAGAYLRSAIVLTFSYVSLNVPPNQLEPELLAFFDDAANDQHGAVRHRFCHIALPYMLPNHLPQLQQRVFELSRNRLLHQALAAGLGLAYETYPDVVLNILDQWISGLPRKLSLEVCSNSPGKREKDLAVAALTYAQVHYVEGETINQHQRTPQWGMSKISNILQKESHGFVRSNCLNAIVLMLGRYFDSVCGDLLLLVTCLTQVEREFLASQLGQLYLSQREVMSGGDELMNHRGRQYAVWFGGRRPKTSVESLMYSWTVGKSNTAAVQVAYWAELEFKLALDIVETAWLEEISAVSVASQENETIEAPLEQSRLDLAPLPLLPAMRKYIRFATFKMSPDIRDNVASLLPAYQSSDVELREKMLAQYDIDGRQELADAVRNIVELHGGKGRKIGLYIVLFAMFLLVYSFF